MRVYDRHLLASLSVAALVLLTPTILGASPATASAVALNTQGTQVHQAKPTGPITLQYWIVFTPDKNGLSALLSGCFKLTGTLQDQAGTPNWTDDSYLDTASTLPKDKCGTWMPLGGGILEPAPKGTLTSAFVYKTITGKLGSIFISFSGTVDKNYQAIGNWFITGGTGAYAGLQGAGTATCDMSHYPYDRHTETGKIWWLGAV